MGTGPGFRITAAMFQYPPLHICNCYIYGEIKNLNLSLPARADTDCYGQIQGPIQKHPYDNIYHMGDSLKINSLNVLFLHDDALSVFLLVISIKLLTIY